MLPCADAEDFYIGLMSGTSLDGVDAVLVGFARAGANAARNPTPLSHRLRPRVLAHAAASFPLDLRHECLALNSVGLNELHRAALAGNAVTRLYAAAVRDVLAKAWPERPGQCATDGDRLAPPVVAIGAHGQTVRHRPGAFDGIGYTLQLQNPALLAELCGIDVVADFRSRDIAAGGQGAPLVPAFHQDWFGRADAEVVVLNIGGIANLSVLPAETPGVSTIAGDTDCSPMQRGVTGFDCGPGNGLMDLWCQRHLGAAYDANGAWAASGTVQQELLHRMLADEPFFSLPAPKSTGRDLFHMEWLENRLARMQRTIEPADVQATLAKLTVQAAANAVQAYAPACSELVVCGGGAFNATLMRGLAEALPRIAVHRSNAFDLPAEQVEATAFAWLARQAMLREPGNLPSVTGARGPRILGAIYPA
jgi:anhydro-N-acetylmuramic acid kinase